MTDGNTPTHIDGLVQTTVSPLLTHWRYCSLNHRYYLSGYKKYWSTEPYLLNVIFDSHIFAYNNLESCYCLLRLVIHVLLWEQPHYAICQGHLSNELTTCQVMWSQLSRNTDAHRQIQIVVTLLRIQHVRFGENVSFDTMRILVSWFHFLDKFCWSQKILIVMNIYAYMYIHIYIYVYIYDLCGPHPMPV